MKSKGVSHYRLPSTQELNLENQSLFSDVCLFENPTPQTAKYANSGIAELTDG